ncbi:LytR C-terminal domain-containing protein [Kytococcus sedentarius]|uniref:LytR C-terminal domain-containing protein n=1 Tax=Kytococcus sedentarius TaxID=1276 RepID=UPI00384D7054
MHPRLVCAAAALLSTALLGGCSSLTTEVAYPQDPVPGHCENWPDLEEVDRAKVQVSVLNNGAGAGAAATAARELEARGFTVLTTGNENEDAPGNAAIVRYGEMGLSAARTVAQQIEGAQLLRDSRRDPTVDVILGEQFEQLARQPAAQPDEVQMNVYNTTAAVGLAGDTADAMRGRGFTVDQVGNDPERKWYPERTAVIRHGAASEPMARTVAAQVPDAVLSDDGRTDQTVDLVLGARFEGPTPEYTEPEAVPEVEQGDKIGCE